MNSKQQNIYVGNPYQDTTTCDVRPNTLGNNLPTSFASVEDLNRILFPATVAEAEDAVLGNALTGLIRFVPTSDDVKSEDIMGSGPRYRMPYAR